LQFIASGTGAVAGNYLIFGRYNMSQKQVVKTACQLCVAICGMNVHLENGKIVKVEGMPEHPANLGRLCPKGAAAIDYVYSKDRLKYPMKKVNGQWQRISWDEALDTIAAKLLEVKEKHGARALAVCVGGTILYSAAPGLTLLRRFLDVHGSPNYFSVDSMCYRPRMIAYIMTYGNYPSPDPENARCIILWASNPRASHPMRARQIERGMKKGAKLIVIDPRRTNAAQKADIHLQVRPGTDCALALGMLNVIISENLYDADFVSNWTVGFDKLAEHVKPFTPEEVEKITWVPAETIRRAARLYATTRPATILQGVNGLDQTTSGFQSARAVAILQAITGNVGTPGGFVTSSGLHLSPMRLPDMVKEKAIAEERYPLAYQIWDRPIGEGQGMVLYDTLLTDEPYPIKAMIIQGSNPLLSWPNSNKLREALGKLDFLAVMTVFMSETAELADIVLPAATFLEKEDIVVDIYWMEYGIPYLLLRKKVLQFEEARSDAEFWLELARRMGYGEYFPWNDPGEVIDYLLEPSGLSMKQLKDEMPGGLQYRSVVYNQHKDRGGFRTPSGKVEIYSETMKNLGYDPLPTYREPIESPISTPELAKDYPVILTTGARMLGNLHSQLRNIPKLRKLAPEPLAEIHPDTARKYNINDGDTITVETKRGSIDIKARVTEDILPGVVNVPHGWSEANVNALTFEQPGDPVSGLPTLKALLCRVREKP